MLEYLHTVLTPSNPVAAIGIIGVLVLLARQLSR